MLIASCPTPIITTTNSRNNIRGNQTRTQNGVKSKMEQRKKKWSSRMFWLISNVRWIGCSLPTPNLPEDKVIPPLHQRLKWQYQVTSKHLPQQPPSLRDSLSMHAEKPLLNNDKPQKAQIWEAFSAFSCVTNIVQHKY